MTSQRANAECFAKWIELIRVRSSQSALLAAMPTLRKQVDEIEAASAVQEAYFLQHALYEGDLAVVLVWCQQLTAQRSREGLLVAEALRELGSVDHVVWVPANA